MNLNLTHSYQFKCRGSYWYRSCRRKEQDPDMKAQKHKPAGKTKYVAAFNKLQSLRPFQTN